MSSVLFLFLAHLGIGIALTLLLVSRAAGVKFFRFNAGLAAVVLLAALAFRPDVPIGGGSGTVALASLVVATGASAAKTGNGKGLGKNPLLIRKSDGASLYGLPAIVNSPSYWLQAQLT